MNKPETFDPKLVAAHREIRAILEKYEIAGHYSLHSATHVKFNVYWPKWSLVFWDKDKKGHDALRIQVKKAEPERSAASAHLLFSMQEVAEYVGHMLKRFCNQYRENVPGLVHPGFNPRDINADPEQD